MAVGQRTDQDGPPHIIGLSEVNTEGISRGVITSLEDAVSTISACLDKTERIIGAPIESVWVGISGSHITSHESKGVVAISKPSGEITDTDVERAVEAARAVATPPNYEILHVIPKSFTVDGQAGIKDPRGMTGIRLEVDTQIIEGLTTQIRNITKAVYRTGLEIDGLVMSILAAAEAVLTSRQKQLGCAVVNLGGSTTSVGVYEEGDVLHTAIIPIGADHITSDLAIGLRISIDAAEWVKLEFGSALPKNINKRDEVDLGEIINSEKSTVSRRYIAEIIEARVEEIFHRVDAELKKVDRSGKLPAGVMLTGGGAKLEGIVEAAKDTLRLPAAIGSITGISSVVEKIHDPAFATAVGLVLWGEQMIPEKKGVFTRMLSNIGLNDFTQKLKRLGKSFFKKT